jgi:hypothetical protein
MFAVTGATALSLLISCSVCAADESTLVQAAG